MKIIGSNILCKGKLEKDFEQIPHSIFNYLALGLITGNDFAVYVKLHQFFNKERYGYAYPTIPQLMIAVGLGKRTVIESLKRLENAGLIKKGKSNKSSNNIYYVYKPLEKSELDKQVPKMVSELEDKKLKLGLQAEQDKQRLEEYEENKQLQEQAQEIKAPTILPKMDTELKKDHTSPNTSHEVKVELDDKEASDDIVLDEVDLRMLERLKLL